MKLDTNAFFRGSKKTSKRMNGSVEMLENNIVCSNNLNARNRQLVLNNGKVKDLKLLASLNNTKSKKNKNKKDVSNNSEQKVVILNEKEVKQLWFSAVKSRNMNLVTSLLAQDIELICFKDKFGYTALHYAIEADDCQMFEKLILSIKTYAQQKQKYEQQKHKKSFQKIKQTHKKEQKPQLQTTVELQVKNNLSRVQKNHPSSNVSYLEKEFHKLHVSQNEQPLSNVQFSLTQAQKNEWILHQQQKQQELQKQQLHQQQFEKVVQKNHEAYRNTCFVCTSACLQCQTHQHDASNFVDPTKLKFTNGIPLYPLSSEAPQRNTASINNMESNSELVQSSYLTHRQSYQQMRNSLKLSQTPMKPQTPCPKHAMFTQHQIISYSPKGFDLCPCQSPQQPKCYSSANYQVFASPQQLSSSSTSLPLNTLPPFPLPPPPPSISSLSSPSLINANEIK